MNDASSGSVNQLRSSGIPNILSIAGSDPGGGAGIQADIKSIGANGGYALAVVTALTAQNTLTVTGVHTPPPEFLRLQLDTVGSDIRIDAVKIGMLGSASIAREILDWLPTLPECPVILDPVMIATSGSRLLDDDAVQAVLELARSASLVTPNLPELALLVGADPAETWSEALTQGSALAAKLGTRVLVKGGHLAGRDCPDALLLPSARQGETVVFEGSRIPTANTHGTGCSLSSAVATHYAATGDWTTAIRRSKTWLEGALRTADLLDVGAGSGPVHAFHALPEQTDPTDRRSFTALAWEDCGDLRREILELPFIEGLVDGTLPGSDFAWYLQQDALYLRRYAAVLASAAALAPTEEEQRFWLSSASGCLETEAELHRTWLAREAGPRFGEGEEGPVTRAYVDHLRATGAGGSYAELVAAVLPCFWLYAAVGEFVQDRVTERVTEHVIEHAIEGRHPYAAWIATYADPDFAAATLRARTIADEAYRRGSVAEQEAMLAAFRWSTRYERDFFDAPRRRGDDAGARRASDLRDQAALT